MLAEPTKRTASLLSGVTWSLSSPYQAWICGSYSLTVLLGPPKPRGFAVRNGQWPNPFADIVRVPGDLGRQIADLDSPAAGKLDIVAEYNSVTVGARRELVEVDVIWVLRAHYDGVDRALMIYSGDPGTVADAVEIVVGDGCRIGRARRHAQTRSVVSELLFDRSLRAGETQVLTYTIRPHSDIECCQHFNGYRFAGGMFVLYVRFHPDALPVRCQRFAARRTEGPTDESAELTARPAAEPSPERRWPSPRCEARPAWSDPAAVPRRPPWSWPSRVRPG